MNLDWHSCMWERQYCSYLMDIPYCPQIRKVNIVQSYIPEQRRARSPHDLIQTLQFSNKKQQDLDNAHACWNNRPACPHPVLWVLGSDRSFKVCPLEWKRWMRRPFQLKSSFIEASQCCFDGASSLRLHHRNYGCQRKLLVFLLRVIYHLCMDTPC